VIIDHTADKRDAHFNNTDIHIKTFAERLAETDPTLIVMEAAGSYERALAKHLHAAGMPVVVANPKRIRDFAKAVGQLAKTDVLDARIIARYAATIKPEAQTAIDAISLEIKDLSARRRQLNAISTAEQADDRIRSRRCP